METIVMEFKRTGTYPVIYTLEVSEEMMPFLQKSFVNGTKDNQFIKFDIN